MTNLRSILLLALLVFAGLLHGQPSWTPLWVATDNIRFFNEPPQAVGQKVIFKAFDPTYVGLWVYDDLSKQTTNLIPSKEGRIVRPLIPFNDRVYFILDERSLGNGSKLWQTDGTPSGTKSVADNDFFRGWGFNYLYVHQDKLYGYGGEGVILAFDGQITESIGSELYYVDLGNLCLFGDTDFIVFDEYDDTVLVRVTGDTVIELYGVIPDGFDPQLIFKHNQNCYVQVRQGSAYNAPQDVVEIKPSGESTRLSTIPGLDNISDIFVHQGQLFAFQRGTDEDNTGALLRLDPNTLSPQSLLSIPDGRFIDHRSIDDDFLYVQFDGRGYLGDRHYVLNAEMEPQLLGRTELFYNGPKQLFSTDSSALVYAENDQPNRFEIDLFAPDQTLTTLRSDGYRFIHAVPTKSAEALYFVLQDRTNGNQGIYTLSEQPTIGSSLSGLWVAPELNNQGLSIRQGMRQSGVPYIFATLYTFQDGEPLWLAGGADYLPNQNIININLFQYAGGGFMDPDAQPSAAEFGQLNLRMTACNQMLAEVSHSSQFNSFVLNRVDNTYDQKHCLTPIAQP